MTRTSPPGPRRTPRGAAPRNTAAGGAAPRRATGLRRATTLGLGLLLALGAGSPAFAAEALEGTPQTDAAASNGASAVITEDVQKASGNIAAFVQLKGTGAYEATQPQDVLKGDADPVKATGEVKAIASAVDGTAQDLSSDSSSKVLYTTHNSVRGVALQGDAQQLRDLASRSDVTKISLITKKFPSNSGTDVDTGALSTWTQTHHTGKGVTIAVIDSGLDYTHADFGGPGTVAAYDQAKASSTMPAGLYDSTKVVGGYDLAGDSYNANDASTVAQPDANPLDCSSGSGHGTHVAGTAAGYGVTKAGKTYRGDWTKLTAQAAKNMKIGPGSAPQAQLVALRVFGCTGSTNLTGQALDRVLDPNGDGDFSDRAQIVNMSLGSDYGPYDDPENDIVTALTRQGILSVVASGNAGDIYSVDGNPGNTQAALTVANSVGSTASVDRIRATAPADVAGDLTGDYSSNYGYASAKPAALKGQVVMAPTNNKYGCQAFTGTDFQGKWVWLDWNDDTGTYPCGSKVRFDNVQAAGGKGVVLAGSVDLEEAGIAGNATIPGVRLNKTSAAKVRAAAEAGTLALQVKDAWKGSILADTQKLDQLNSSSSRGQHGSAGFIKPDVAAPGTAIGSAGVASGNGIKVMSGTSMATPHTAGIAALVLEAHPSYTPQNIKAAIMNTAVHDVTLDGHPYSVERVGSGRVDARRAVDQDVLVYNADQPDQVSSTFGVVEAAGKTVRTYTRKLTVQNQGGSAHSYAVSLAQSTEMPGVTLSVSPSVSVGAHGTATVTVTATVDAAALQKTRDVTTEETQEGEARQYLATASGRVVLTEKGKDLRVPVQIAPKPVAAMTVRDSAIRFLSDTDSTNVHLSGTALDQGGYVSALGAFQLGATSAKIPTGRLAASSLQATDLQYVGASSTVPELKAQAASSSTGDADYSNATLSFGISTWGNWESIMPSAEYQVAIDVDGDHQSDYYVISGVAEGLDYPLAKIYKVVNGSAQLVDSEPINGSWGDTDTNTMDSNTMVMPVKLSTLGLDPTTSKSISYQVSTYHWLAQDAVDSTDWISYNPVKPNLWFSAGEKAQGEKFNSILFQDKASTLTAHKNGSASTKALFLHLHNATGDLSGLKSGEDGAKAQVVGVQAAASTIRNPRFTDVTEQSPNYQQIAWMASRKIDTGYSDGSYRPGAVVDRATMAAYLYRLAGSPQYTAPETSPFTDVKTSDTYYKEMAWAAEHGLTTKKNGAYDPHGAVTRGMAAAFMYRLAGSPAYTAPKTSAFSDLKPGSTFYKELSWAQEKGIIQAESGRIQPSAQVTRGEMAAYLFALDKKVISAY